MTGPTVRGPMYSSRPLLMVVVVAAVLVAWLTWRFAQGTREPTRAAQECKTRYAKARTFRDTVAVDQSYPTEYALEHSSRMGPATCGRLRREKSLP